MRRLILMRHGKSSWDGPKLDDIDRPLNKRGRRGAERVGAWLKERGYVPQRALVSAARRTRETWDLVAPSLGPVPVEFLLKLYHAAPEIMLEALRRGGEAEVLLVIGHQPGIGALARALLRDPPKDAAFAKYPTAATAVIDLDVPGWDGVGFGDGRLADFVVPRALE